jgi:hypothetical protein
MKTVRRLLVLAFAGAALWATSALAADQTWKGTISDSNCGHSHKAAVEHAGKALSDHDCTVACVKGGAKYVFVAGGKVYDIANQDFAGLDTNAGKPVQVAGTMNGNAITIAKVTAGK